MRLVVFALLISSSMSAHAAWPPSPGDDLSQPANWPNDPSYGGQWSLFSFIPEANKEKVSDYEKSIGSGLHADRAWMQTLGSTKVIVAITDSGIRWGDRDLVNQFYLNRGELPVPSPACGVNTADPHDANGDGTFNVQDYTTATGHEQPSATLICHAGLSDMNGNGIVDPQDLILLYSDGGDEDLNGWIDDISGWDNFHDDNDAFDETNFGHGTGQASGTASEVNNGIGKAGVCPTCRLLMIRAGDSFVADSNYFAMGVAFAVDSGATVLEAALGTINGSQATQQAIDYAWKEGLAFVASAADENSFHANLPGSYNHTIYVHANVYNNVNRDNATSYLAFNNCTNYGANLQLSVPASACSSEATALAGGMAGLLYGAALEAGIAPKDNAFALTDVFQSRVLLGEEVKQLMLTTVDDIYDPQDANDPSRYITYEGWEKRFGYGRTNLGNAVEAVMNKRIPPVVDVIEPRWYKVVDPAVTPNLSITGEIDYRTEYFDSYDYVVEWAAGIEPTPSDWQTIASAENQTAPIKGEIATLNTSELNIDNPPMPIPDVDVNRYMVTVRIRVTLNSSDPTRDKTTGRIRRAFHVRHDADTLQGYPIQLPASVESPPTFSDLDGDSAMELIVADSAGTVHVYDQSGNQRAGFPVKLGVIDSLNPANPANKLSSSAFASGGMDANVAPAVMGAVGVGAIKQGEAKSIVVTTLDGSVHILNADGTPRDGFPVRTFAENARPTDAQHTIERGIFGAPVLEDITADGNLEIIVAGLDGFLYAWTHDGDQAPGFPAELSSGDQRRRSIQTPSVGDIDGDGKPEIVCGSNEDYNGSTRLYAFNHDGTIVDGWPVFDTSPGVLPYVGTGMPNSTALVDVDDDGIVEVVSSAIASLPTVYNGAGQVVKIMTGSPGGPLASSNDTPSFVTISSGSIGDLNNDGKGDIVWGTAGLQYATAFAFGGERIDFDHQVSAWDIETESYMNGFPQRVDDHQFFMNPTIADVDGDRKPEVISGSGGYYVRAWDVDGTAAGGFPKFTGGWIIGAPALGDIDGDGMLEVAAATREGDVFVWRTTGKTEGRVDWPNFHHDERNTGNFHTPLDFGASEVIAPAGCCDASERLPTTALLLLALGLLVLRRSYQRH